MEEVDLTLHKTGPYPMYWIGQLPMTIDRRPSGEWRLATYTINDDDQRSWQNRNRDILRASFTTRREGLEHLMAALAVDPFPCEYVVERPRFRRQSDGSYIIKGRTVTRKKDGRWTIDGRGSFSSLWSAGMEIHGEVVQF